MSELSIKKLNDEVYVANEDIVQLDYRAINFIKNQALVNERGRARICAHKKPSDNLHEMMIAIRSDSYIRPHRHHKKIESFHLIEGRADVVILEDNGEIKKIVPLGKENYFYYRLTEPFYHTLFIHTPLLVIHEITNGPFDINLTDYADFAPTEDDTINCQSFLLTLKEKISHYASK